MTDKRFNGSTQVGYSCDDVGTFCLEHVTDKDYGITEEELELGQQDGSVEPIMNNSWEETTICKVCGKSLIDLSFPTNKLIEINDKLYPQYLGSDGMYHPYQDETGADVWFYEEKNQDS